MYHIVFIRGVHEKSDMLDDGEVCCGTDLKSARYSHEETSSILSSQNCMVDDAN